MISANKLVRSKIETRFSSPMFLSAHPHMKSLFSACHESDSVGSGIAKTNKPVLKGHTLQRREQVHS